MSEAQQTPQQSPEERRMFTTTSWTAVIKAGQTNSPAAAEALNQLCLKYWGPVHTYLRRLGHSQADAQDLTQGFFYLLLTKNYLQVADRTKGRFRSFLLTAVDHFVTNQRERSQAVKRGGGKIPISLEELSDDEDGLKIEPASELSPAKHFEREWARTLFAQVESKLREEYAARGEAVLFDHLKQFVDGRADAGEYAPVAALLGKSENAVTVAAHRLKHRYGEQLRAEVAETLVNPTRAEIQAELQHLFDIFCQ